MATITKGRTFLSGETVTPQKLNALVDDATISGIVNSEIAAGAGIVDTKLAVISTPGKVANSATSATNANTPNTIVARDGSGNFSAGTITANITGNVSGSSGSCTGNAATATQASNALACSGNAATATLAATCSGNSNTATRLQTARTINGVAFDGSGNITVTAEPNAHTHDDRYYTETEMNTLLSGKQAAGSYAPATGIAPSAITGTAVITTDSRLSDARTPTSHTHDDRYYTETEMNTLLSGKQAAGSYAPATGIAPSAITGTAVVTSDSRLSDARTPVSHTHFAEVLQPGSIYSSASVGGGSVFELTSGVSNGSAYSEINFHRGAAVGIATPYATFYQSGTIRGTISPTGASGVAYNTTSDYRLKTNLEPLTDAVARLLQIPVHRFNWLADPTAPKVVGFLAHEAQAVVPESVTGHKDEVDAEGKPIHQGIDQSKLVPLLVAAVQELAARVAALEAR